MAGLKSAQTYQAPSQSTFERHISKGIWASQDAAGWELYAISHLIKTKKMNEVEFTRGLIKGKIVEIIFEMMMREMDRVTVLRAGYEYTHPELAQYQQLIKSKGKEVLKFFEHNPDFILFKKDKSSLYLVEVKYRHHFTIEEICKIADDELARSEYIWLFIATPEKFYFSQCKDIARTKAIEPLSKSWVLAEIQQNYLALLNEFILIKP